MDAEAQGEESLHAGSEVLGAREDPGRRDFQQKTVYAFIRRRRRKVAFKECPNVAMAEFKDVGTPACTREEKQSTENVKGSSV